MKSRIEIIGGRTNFEKYKQDIFDWAEGNETDRFCIKDEKLVPCYSHGIDSCSGCMFHSIDGCQSIIARKTVKWLLATPSVEIKLSDPDRRFCESVKTGYISRGGTGLLFWSLEKPVYDTEDGLIFRESGHIMFPDNIANQWGISFNFIEKGQSYEIQNLLNRNTGV